MGKVPVPNVISKIAFNSARRICIASVAAAACAVLSLPARNLSAYPSAEVLGPASADPPFDFSISSTLSGFLLISDRRLVISYSDIVKIIDMGSYEFEALQPPALSSVDGTDGVIGGIGYDSGNSRILASQADGDMLFYSLSDITAKPASVVLAKGDSLGPIAVDTNGGIAYVADNTAKAVQGVDLATSKLVATIPLLLPSSTSFTITDGVYDSNTSEVYFTTSAGSVFYIASRGTVASRIDVDVQGKKSLAAIDVIPGGGSLYVVDATTPSVVRISTSSHSVTVNNMDISSNPSPTDIAVTAVTNPNGNYAFVAGAATPGGGMSVIDAGSDTVFDLGTDALKTNEPIATSLTPRLVAASSSADGYVYMGYQVGKIGFLSANPLITINSITFSDGGSTLKQNQSMTMKFQSNQTGTYTIMAGGGVDASGTLLKDDHGNTSGSITLNTETSVTINQADNASALVEGANDIWIFVTASPNRGRIAQSVVVDTPPPNVVIDSADFGNGRAYINFARLTVSDMSIYRIYLDTDPAAVLTKSDIAGTVAQASSGSTQTGEVGGLVNGTTYYVAMEAVDAGGNVSPARTNKLPDGSVAFAVPEATVGPAGLLGEKGCSISTGLLGSSPMIWLLMMSPLPFIISRRRAVKAKALT